MHERALDYKSRLDAHSSVSRWVSVKTGLAAGIVVAPLAIWLSVMSGGAGHGGYVWARLLLPIPLAARDFGTTVMIVAAIVQYPCYGAAVGYGFAARRGAGAVVLLLILLCHAGVSIVLLL
jgi:hypothetical protein